MPQCAESATRVYDFILRFAFALHSMAQPRPAPVTSVAAAAAAAAAGHHAKVVQLDQISNRVGQPVQPPPSLPTGTSPAFASENSSG
jgi:hypothetical protein